MDKTQFNNIVEYVMKNRCKTNDDGINYYEVKSCFDDSIVVRAALSDDKLIEYVNDYGIDVELKMCQALAIKILNIQNNG